MKFVRLFDPLLSVLFEDDDIVAIDKPYGFNAHTNDSKIEHSDFIQDGLIEIYEKNLGQKLHIIHRLDQTTTGVMIFGKSQASAKKYAEFFFDRKVKKTYWFITKHTSTQNQYHIDQIIIHKGKDLDANTDLNLVKKSDGFELWQAEPHTGRNHQIRIHAQAAGIPILGDPKYDGIDYPFLCLHNCKIEFPNGLILESKPPAYFENLSLLKNSQSVQIVFEADRRQRLFSKADKDQCYRLVHHKNKFKNSDFTLDQYGQHQISQPPSTNHSEQIPAWIAVDNGLKFKLQLDSKNNVGLFTNQRLQRNWVQQYSNMKKVLNLFAYKGSYSIAAAKGLAAQVTSVDLSKSHLNASRENFELNQLPQENHLFLLRDSFSYIQQCQLKNNKFDLIICDTPAFYRREKGVFKIEDQIESLLESCLSCLDINGTFLFSTTADDLFIDTIRNAIAKVQKKMSLENLEISCLLPSVDFELPDEKVNLKSFLIQKK
jgi:23S rRNA (cytosine1962-C5)-methyltransferase